MPMITHAGVASIKGLDHQLNEDRYRLLDARVPVVREAGRGFLYGVMDGVGSAPKGMHAAQHVADRLNAFYMQPEVAPTSQGLSDLLSAVNLEIHGWGMVPGTRRSLGAAVATVAWFVPTGELLMFHSGDSMAWRFDGQRLTRLVHEHTDGQAITSCLGMGDGMRLDVERVAYAEGDVLCLASDGVTKSLSDEDVRGVLERFPDPEAAARELVRTARARGSRDDITALVIELEEWSPPL